MKWASNREFWLCWLWGVVVEVGVLLGVVVEVHEVGLAVVALFLSVVVMAGVMRIKNLFLVLRKIRFFLLDV